MRALTTCLGITFVALGACTQYKDASTLPYGTRVTVETADGAMTATVAADPRAIALVGADGRMIDPSRITSIYEVKHGHGALQGFGLAFLAGATVGAIVGYSDGDDECSDDGFCILQFSAGEKAAFAAVGVGTLSGLFGLVVGAAIGSKDVYTFGGNREHRFAPTGPAGSVAGATIRF